LCFEDTHFEYLEEEEANPISHQDAIDAVNGEKRAAGENEQNGEETTSAQEQEAGIQAIRAGEIRTLDGDIAGDEFASDAINYQVLLGKIDALLERLKLDA
jgi:ankyrin repeat/BTB/POZ domain-containing protein 1